MAGWGLKAVTKERQNQRKQRNMLHVPASADTAELKARESSTSQASLGFLSSLLTCNKMRQTERRCHLNFCSEASQKGTET